ncbi:ATPase AAA [Spirochaetia bacterium]|nr:ATPase AAA [Spirochaetia bacterium]
MKNKDIISVLDPNKELNDEQQKAVCAEFNTVVTAGAGSGKTKVLAMRFAYLVMEKGYKIDEILTMTFTNKAVNEMYDRIYKTLNQHRDNKNACTALENFNKANIKTFDSLCGQIARIAANRFGIQSDFTVDNQGVDDLALKAAIPFVFRHRENSALQFLITENKLIHIAKDIFASPVLNDFSSIVKPINYEYFMNNKKKSLEMGWEDTTKRIYKNITKIQSMLSNVELSKSFQNIANAFRNNVDFYDFILSFDQKEKIIKIINDLSSKTSEKTPGNSKNEELTIVKELYAEIKKNLLPVLNSIADIALQWETIKEIFPLMEEFQKEFNEQKRLAGILTFNDVSSLALKALTNYSDIRKLFKNQFKAIMCDEFQDNNRLQKDLLFLLAENLERDGVSVPKADELIKNKLFFVGDEKQSIYRFRGADVSVFRKLSKELADSDGGNAHINLVRNYRSSPSLIKTFNYIFGGIDPDDESNAKTSVFLKEDDPNQPEYEAVYHKLSPPENEIDDNENAFTFCPLTVDDNYDENDMSKFDIEAAFIANKICMLVKDGITVREKINGTLTQRPCTFNDFAVLQRTTTHQHELEKHFKIFGVPYNAENPTGLFYDAPVNDLLNILRLIQYPSDAASYAAFLKSPFVRLSDEGLLICSVYFNETKESRAIPFHENVSEALPPDQKEIFFKAKELYEAIKEDAAFLRISELLSKLWYDYGYRYETLWDAQAQIYSELFDYIFEIARTCDERGNTLSEFLDYVDNLAANELKHDDLDIPLERKDGVHIMSIHKSKGLEFPVVFIYGCGNRGHVTKNDELVFFNEDFGPCINLPSSPELDDEVKNYFFEKFREDEKLKDAAELKRLFYVAATRAESRLYLSAIMPNRNESVPNILQLFLSVYEQCEKNNLICVEAIPVMTRQMVNELAKKAVNNLQSKNRNTGQLEMSKQAEINYDGSLVITNEKFKTFYLTASKLQIEDFEEQENKKDTIDILLEKSGISHAEFGTIVHSILESKLNKTEPNIPITIMSKIEDAQLKQILAVAGDLASGFMETTTGKLFEKSAHHESEYPFLTLLKADEKNIYISGQIDLFFITGGVLNIVDFKTDKIENPSRHYNQLKVYKNALNDIFPGHNIQTWLFYARTGNIYQIDKALETVEIESVILNALIL